MNRRFLFLSAAAVLALVACADSNIPMISDEPVHFWRPISEPNIFLQSDKLQTKLQFDLGQCSCGIYPKHMTHDENVRFQPDKQRLVETSVSVVPDEDGNCGQTPSLVVTECMRSRGWEPTNCSGRLPLPNGGSLCATYVQPRE